jgi:hypothetical protein
MMYTDAERTASALLLEQERAVEYPMSKFERLSRFERNCSYAHRVRETIDGEMKKLRADWSKNRYETETMIRFWLARHTRILTAKGTAAIDHKAFVTWMKQISKIIPTQKARGEVGKWMKDPQYSTVTLDLIDGKLSASFYCAVNGEWGWTTATLRLDCPVSEGTFTATVDFDALYELARLLDNGAVILRKDRAITPLVLEQKRSTSRLKHRSIGEQLVWMIA